ncbi:hypothetical protein C5167_022968 [Papaver somniferum]|uniref:Anion-transporting ATPase-like domain-containing protein n=1 Tax=Papaver somniferum TaxID=3469 RepID=A0A4Y7JMF1_PAPSO|nr:hypothetical protein C5167_022968 [Papaver somniferum]
MSSSLSSSFIFTSSPIQWNHKNNSKPNPNFFVQFSKTLRPNSIKMSAESNTTTKLVTFLGKGGSGKTTSSILAAQYYAKQGLNTCLVIQSQDPTAEYLMGCKIGTSPTQCNNNLSVVRFDTTKVLLKRNRRDVSLRASTIQEDIGKETIPLDDHYVALVAVRWLAQMLLEPLNQLKKADARLNFTQGVIEGVVGEELGVLPGMGSIFAALALQKLVGVTERTSAAKKQTQEKFDIVIYDGVSNEETLRMISATETARSYLKYLRNLAEKTDIGRLTAPSLLRLAEESVELNDGRSRFDGKMSSDIWNDIERMLEVCFLSLVPLFLLIGLTILNIECRYICAPQRVSTGFAKPSKLSCYLVMDPNNPTSINAAMRYWGCAIQSGAHISGAFGYAPPQSTESADVIKTKFSPLPSAIMPYLSIGSPIDWDAVVLKSVGEDVRLVFAAERNDSFPSPVTFNAANKSVTLFMPGFDKSEIKLFQYRGGSELLVEAGDQRRVIRLPNSIQGKVGGAKFVGRSVVVTMR